MVGCCIPGVFSSFLSLAGDDELLFSFVLLIGNLWVGVARFAQGFDHFLASFDRELITLFS